MQQDNISGIALAWKILYDEEYEDTPDPNKPENIPYMTAKKEERKQMFERLMNGPAKVLFDEWKKKIKENNLALVFMSDERMCNCPACYMIREIRYILNLLIEAQTIISEQ